MSLTPSRIGSSYTASKLHSLLSFRCAVATYTLATAMLQYLLLSAVLLASSALLVCGQSPTARFSQPPLSEKAKQQRFGYGGNGYTSLATLRGLESLLNKAKEQLVSDQAFRIALEQSAEQRAKMSRTGGGGFVGNEDDNVVKNILKAFKMQKVPTTASDRATEMEHKHSNIMRALTQRRYGFKPGK